MASLLSNILPSKIIPTSDSDMSNAMEDVVHEEPPVHPVALRLNGTGGRPTPHVGPTIEHYRKHHATTIGDGSDEFWGNVSLYLTRSLLSYLILDNRRQEKCYIGTGLSIPLEPAHSKQAILYGFLKVV